MTFVVARPDAYVRLHHRILDSIARCVPITAVRSIDELVCDLTPEQAADAPSLARRIKGALLTDFSEALTCSIGLAQTELLAKIAADLVKPDGLTVLDAADLPTALASLPLAEIPGISTGMEARLQASGVFCFNDLWAMEPKRCRAVWGSIEGERFWNALHGVPYIRPSAEKRMFGHSRMLPLDWRTPERVADCARQLLQGAARRLRRANRRCTKMTLSVRGGGYRSARESVVDTQRWNAEIPFRPACDDWTLARSLTQLCATYCREVTFSPRSVSVTLHGLVEAEERQCDFFDEVPEHPASQSGSEVRRAENLSRTIDDLRMRFGAGVVSVGVHDEVPGGYLGAKIAFGRIPDVTDFTGDTRLDHETQFCTM